MTVVRTLDEANVGVKLSAGSAAGTQPIDTTPEGQDGTRASSSGWRRTPSLPTVPTEGRAAGEEKAPAEEAPAQPG
jgi:hypothetical protein